MALHRLVPVLLIAVLLGSDNANALPLEMKVLIAQGQYDKPLAWLQQHSEAGDAQAQFDLARLLRSDIAGVRNLETADHWLSAAASQGHRGARELLAEMSVRDTDKTNLARQGKRIEIANSCHSEATLGNTPLHHAAHGNDLNAIVRHLRDGCDVNHRNASGVTALHIAIANSNADIVEALLDAGANRKMEDGSGWNAIELASRKGDTAVMRLFDITVAKASSSSGTPQQRLAHALVTGNEAMAAEALDAGARWWQLAGPGHTREARTFQAAIIGRNDALISQVISETPHERSATQAITEAATAIQRLAASAGNSRTFTSLMPFARPDASTASAALDGQCSACIEALLDADQKDWPRDALVRSIKHRQFASAQRLATLAGAAHRVDEQGRSALWWAAQSAPTGLSQVLLKAGADPNLPDLAGRTPLHAAIEAGNRDVAALLIAFDSQVIHTPSGAGVTPLMLAASKPDHAITRSLIAAGAKIDERNAAGETALFLAIRANNLEAARVLVQARATLGIRNQAGVSAGDLLADHPSADFRELLQQAPGLLDRLLGSISTSAGTFSANSTRSEFDRFAPQRSHI